MAEDKADSQAQIAALKAVERQEFTVTVSGRTLWKVVVLIQYGLRSQWLPSFLTRDCRSFCNEIIDLIAPEDGFVRRMLLKDYEPEEGFVPTFGAPLYTQIDGTLLNVGPSTVLVQRQGDKGPTVVPRDVVYPDDMAQLEEVSTPAAVSVRILTVFARNVRWGDA